AALSSLSVNGAILTDMLRWGFQMDDVSLYSGISFLTPGTIMSVGLTDNHSLRSSIRDCWRAQSAYSDTASSVTDKETLRRAISNSVREHLISDVPVAIALSGGLDSSVVAAAA